MLLCNRVGHLQLEIKSYCTKKSCIQYPACCRICKQQIHDGHEITDFSGLEEIMNDNWLTSRISNLQKFIEEIQAMLTEYLQTYTQLLVQSDAFTIYQQTPNLSNLNELARLKKQSQIMDQQFGVLENHFQEFKINIEEQCYKTLKKMMKNMPTNRVQISNLNFKEKGTVKSQMLFINQSFYAYKLHLSKLKQQEQSLRQQINLSMALLKNSVVPLYMFFTSTPGEKSIRVINGLFDKYPQNQKIFSKRCKIYEDAKNGQMVLDLLNQNTCLTEKKKLIIRMKALNQLNRFQESIECCDQAIKLDPQNSKLYQEKGIEQHTMEYKTALKFLDFAISLNPYNPQFYHDKAEILYKLNKYEISQKYTDLAISVNPQDPQVYIIKSKRLHIQKDQKEYMKCIDQAISLDPRNPQFLFLKAQRLADINEIIQYLDEALELEPYNQDMVLIKCLVLMQGNPNEALIYINKFISENNETLENLILKCIYKFKLKYNNEYDVNQTTNELTTIHIVLKQFRQIHQNLLDKKQNIQQDYELTPQFYINQAEDLLKSQNYVEAIQSYDMAFSFDPKNPSILFAQAEALRLLNRYNQAEIVEEQAMSLIRLNDFQVNKQNQ